MNTIWMIQTEGTHYLNLSLCSTAAIISIVACVGIIVNRMLDRVGTRYLVVLGILNLLLSVSYIVELIYEHRPGQIAFIMMYAADTLEYLIPYLLSFTLTFYVIHLCEDAGGWIERKWIIVAIYVVLIGALGLNIWHKKYFYISAENAYVRGDLFWLSQVIGIGLIILAIVLLFRYGYRMEIQDKMALLLYMAAPITAIVLQIFMQGIFLFVLATTVSLLLIVLYTQIRQTRRYYISEKELSEAKIALLLSQVRPHFIYNALSSISQLCKKDPEKASEMTDRFAEFLRKNMADINENGMIPFRQELQHLENYISIEQMRFGDAIRVSYDIQAIDFCLPPLVLQPIVENAIRHGIRQREEGGIIYISTRYAEGNFLITIADDGVGYDPKKLPEDNDLHLGMEAVKKRMASIPHASFIIASKPGIGTTATFIIPDMGAEKMDVSRNNI